MGNNYAEYVIKDGKFIGRFEEMYRNCDDPWHQSRDVLQSYSKMSSVASLERLHTKNVLEVGCGLGYYTNFLHKIFPQMKICGMDISKTAIKKAEVRFPELHFICDTINNIDRVLEIPRGDGKIDTVIFSEILWYILDDLDEILNKLKEHFYGGYILINQTFYYGGQEYGKEFFVDQDEMVQRLGIPCIEKVRQTLQKEGGSYSTHTVLRVE